jgi:hypothetical protein
MSPRILRYVGVHCVAGTREYAFTLKQDEERHFTIVVSDADFITKKLSFQEAPDLCYQKLWAELEAEGDVPVARAIRVTAEDLARYREGHQPGSASRRKWSRP